MKCQFKSNIAEQKRTGSPQVCSRSGASSSCHPEPSASLPPFGSAYGVA